MEEELEWLRDLTVAAEILMPDEMRQILAARQPQLEEEEQLARAASMAVSKSAESESEPKSESANPSQASSSYQEPTLADEEEWRRAATEDAEEQWQAEQEAAPLTSEQEEDRSRPDSDHVNSTESSHGSAESHMPGSDSRNGNNGARGMSHSAVHSNGASRAPPKNSLGGAPPANTSLGGAPPASPASGTSSSEPAKRPNESNNGTHLPKQDSSMYLPLTQAKCDLL